MPLAAALQAINVLLAVIRAEGAMVRGMVIHKAEAATREGGDKYVFYFKAVHTVVVAFPTVFVTRVLAQREWLWTAAVAVPTACLRKRTCSVATQSQFG